MTERKPRPPSRGRRAKIICTLGPSTDNVEVLRGLIRGGMDVARLNLSFGTVDEHLERIANLRTLAASMKSRPVAIMADLPGRKIRVRNLEGTSIMLETGSEIRLDQDDGQCGNTSALPVDARLFHDGLMQGDTILLADGVVELQITSVRKASAEAKVIYGGEVHEHTGVHAPGMPLTGSAITERDMPFLRMIVEERVDYCALTYVGDAVDVVEVRERLSDLGRNIPIIAKIERGEAFSRLDGILRRADAVMIRRGDLGAQIEITRIPAVQKEILRLAGQAGKPAIIATQMLGSMVENPRPTRAEASDVSNAIADGADGVLLSAETAIGKYPTQAVDMMSRIVRETELEGVPFRRIQAPFATTSTEVRAGFAHTTARIACEAAAQTQAKMIVCFTESGRTARLVAKYRPHAPIIAFCSKEETRRRLALNWGVRTDSLDVAGEVEAMVRRVEQRLTSFDLVRDGDRLVIIFGAPVGEKGQTNSVRLHVVGVPPTPTRDLTLSNYRTQIVS
ncbi:MAG: pyruvate kinase [Myxococcales bacterium]|nr:pyruvate kinase [Myxococcales bacterium]